MNPDLAQSPSIDEAAELLSSHPDYRLVRRLVPTSKFSSPSGNVARGVIVDTETTGLNQDTDKIIEVSILAFTFDTNTGEVFEVVDVLTSFEDPGQPISAESTAIHGITDEMVSGKRIDDDRVNQIVAGAKVVIAHNASFDRPLLERRLPIFESLPWACSFQEVDWSGEGIGSAKLEYIAYQYGFFYDAHRAEMDCYAVLEVLRRPLPVSKKIPLLHLFNRTTEKDWVIGAIGSPFETKDILRQRGYRWQADRKIWAVSCNTDKAKEEIEWLKANVYKKDRVKLEFEPRDSLSRYSRRNAERVVKEV